MRTWTQNYKQFLESLLPGAEDAKAKAPAKAGAKKTGGKGDKDKEKAPTRHIRDFKENHTDTTWVDDRVEGVAVQVARVD